MTEAIASLKDIFLDLIFPRMCVNCKTERVYICDKCKNLIEKNQNPKIFIPSKYINYIFAPLLYRENSLISRLIHQFKYKFSTELCSVFVSFIAPILISYFNPNDIILVPMPLHKKRLLFRGFNQAELICEELKNKHKYRWINLLKRTKNTKPQASLSREERLTNLIGAFEIENRSLFDCSIVLVDDITTTGATLNECARVLYENGHKNIIGLVIAHGK